MIGSVKNTLDILNCFSLECPEIRVTDVSKKLGLSKSTVSRLLSTLNQEGVVARIPTNQKYRLGSKVLELANIYLLTVELGTLALPYLRDLRDEMGETASIFIIDGEYRICIENVESSQEVRPIIKKGIRLPLHAGSAGKLLLAFLPDERRKEILSKTGLPSLTENTITDLKRLEDEMTKIRRDGYAVSDQERVSYVSSISAPIRDFKGEVTAALCLSTIKMRFKDKTAEEAITSIKIAAEKISKELGYAGIGQSHDSGDCF